MCDPVTIGVVASVAGTAFSVYGQMQAGAAQEANLRYQAQLQEHNAKVAENEATLARQAAQADADTIDRRRKIFIAQQEANFAARGVTIGEGSTLDVLGDSAAEFELERQNRLHEGELGRRRNLIIAEQDRANAAGLRAQGRQARSAANMAALGSLAKGAFNVSGSLGGSTLGGSGMPRGTSGMTTRQYIASYPANAL
jgi:hypothetical protein